MRLWVFILACSIRPLGSVEQSIDMMELNHYYDQSGHHVYSQIIFWEWQPDVARFAVRGYEMLSDRIDPDSYKDLTQTDSMWTFRITKDKRNYVFRSTCFRTSYTQTDPEREDKKRSPEHLRNSIYYPKERTK